MTHDPTYDRLVAQGLMASRENRPEEALACFARAGEVAPASGVPHFLIGSEHAAAGDMESAEAALARAVLLAPDFALARYQLGLLQFTSRRAAVALLTWQPLLSLAATDPLLHFVRGFEALGRASFREALQHYREGLACHEINQGLASDIERVVEAVGKLAAAPAAEAQDEAGVHVLLSSYGKGLH